MKPFFWLRILALLKQSTRALQSIADSQHRIAVIIEDDFNRRYAPRRKPVPVQLGTLDIEKINDRWERRREAEEAGVEFTEEGEEGT